MSENPARQTFVRYFVVGLCWMAFFSVVDELADRTWLVKRMETANLDALFRARQKKVSTNISVVDVTDEDYQKEFGGQSPLNPGKLREIIDAIMASDPTVLGVDFDTSAWPGEPPQYAAQPIVWAREAIGTSKLSIGKVLGGSPGACSGVTAFFPDEDGLIRDYSEFIQGSDGLFYPSMAIALAHRRDAKNCLQPEQKLTGQQSAEPRRINFQGEKNAFDHLSAGTVLQLSKSPVWTNKPLRGRIVLLGGSWHASRDAYPTPFGYLDGVDIIANTVETSIPGGSLSESPVWLQVLGYAEGVALLAILYFVPPGWSLAIALLTGPIYAVLMNWFAFQSRGTFISLVPCFVGIAIHHLVDHIREYRHLERENQELRMKLKERATQTS